VHYTKFHPIGRRPLDGGNADGGFTTLPLADYLKQANEQRFTSFQIEDPEPLDELEAIASLPGFDILFFGPGDMTQGLGAPGDFNHPRVIETRKRIPELARKHGFHKVSQLKLAVAKRIKEFVTGGGFMFAMCSATDTYDIALSAEGIDMCDKYYDGDGSDPGAQEKLDYEKTLAFTNFTLERNPLRYEFSDIDKQPNERGLRQADLVVDLAEDDLGPGFCFQGIGRGRIGLGRIGRGRVGRGRGVRAGVRLVRDDRTLWLGRGRWIVGLCPAQRSYHEPSGQCGQKQPSPQQGGI